MNDYILILSTFPSKKEAKTVMKALLEKKLIACATMLPEVTSLYFWEGKVEEGKEIEVLMKAKEAVFEKICALIEVMHSYEVPQILKLPISGGSKNYLRWIDENTKLF